MSTHVKKTSRHLNELLGWSFKLVKNGIDFIE